MSRTEIEKRMRELEGEIRRHRDLYYVHNQPEISDRQFDRLFAELIRLEARHTDLASPDSPTVMVGSDLDGRFEKVRHTIPVLSLSNTYSTAEALEWARKIAAVDSKMLFSIQWKVDGASLVLYYENGFLERAATRGTGTVGDDITANALTLNNVPHQLTSPRTLAVRGEVYITYSDFALFNEREGSVYANPRNTAAGSLKLKNPRETAARPLRLVVYDAYFQDEVPDSDRRMQKILAELGLPVFADGASVTVQKLERTIQSFEERRGSVDFPVDGLVLKTDSLSLREELGSTAASPRWAVALKFEAEQGESTVEDIELFVGRTGRVTPRARLRPVKLAGTTVAYATLHNEDFIKRLDIRIGSRVVVSKRGEIIPAVEEVLEVGEGKAFRFPRQCPSCKTVLVREPGTADRVCQNPLCDEKRINALIFFCGRKQMDIAGLGEKIIRLLYRHQLLGELHDIYRLVEHRTELEALEGLGKKSVGQLLEAIERSKNREFRHVLPALGLKEIGPAVTEILFRAGFDSIDRIVELARSPRADEILEGLDGIGPRIAEIFKQQFADEQILKRIELLQAAGLRFEQEAKAVRTDFKPVFRDQVWCITGSFQHYQPREKALEEIRVRGGRIVTQITTKTTHLLCGEGGGGKLARAEKLGVKIVNEKEFQNLL